MTKEDAGLVVVGVDGTAESDAALAFALDEAARSGDSVKVVTVWHPTTPALSYPVVPMGKARIRTQMCAAHTRAMLETAASAFAQAGRELGVIGK